MISSLPPLDRVKLGLFLKTEKERLVLREGRWVPKGILSLRSQGRYDLIQEMIGRLVAGDWDQKVLP